MHSLLADYTQIIGGGDYGVVKTRPDNSKVVKFLYAPDCPDARQEYILNRKVYDAYKIFLQCTTVPHFAVAKPISFLQGESSNGDYYKCALVMERLRFTEQYAIHAALNGVVPQSKLNKLALISLGVPRGYFYGPQKIEILIEQVGAGISSLPDITYRIGLLDSIAVFGARMIPQDAEYVLNIKRGNLSLTMLDFGKFREFNLTPDNYKEIAEQISNAQEYNLYYHPYSEALPPEEKEECKEAFLEGFALGYKCLSLNNDNRLLYEALLEIYHA